MISNCGHDENGKYSGGKAGDQTGGEWERRSWYNRPWTHVFRHPTTEVQNLIAELAGQAADNDHIGYDQNERLTFWNKLKKAGYYPKNITSNCEADCSSGVAAIVKAVGYLTGSSALQNVDADMYTGSERSELKKAGFAVLTDSKYTGSQDYLLPGDILLYEGHHTCINLDAGGKAQSVADNTKGVLTVADIKDIYATYLGRLPESDAVISAWQAHAQKSGAWDAAKTISSSDEARKYFVKTCYWNLLGRAADDSGLKSWTNAMKNGKTRADVVQGIMNSAEYKNRK